MFNRPETVSRGIRIGWTVLMVGLILVVLWRVSSQIFVWLRHRLTSREGSEFESLPGAFKEDFLSWLKHKMLRYFGFRLFKRRGKSGSTLPGIASVREVYRQLLHRGAAWGYPRGIAQTPHEYLSNLVDLLPSARRDLELITQYYVTARYGTSLPNEYELSQLKESWYKIKQSRIKKMGN